MKDIFERRDELTHEPLVPLKFDRLQGYGVNGTVVGLDIVLKGGSDEGDTGLQAVVEIPKPLQNRYKMMIQAAMLHLKVDIDVMDDYQSVVGIRIREVIMLHNSGGERECWACTLSDEGEAAYFRLPDHLGIIFAITNDLPILVEERVLAPKSVLAALHSAQKYLAGNQEGGVDDRLDFLDVLYKMIEQEEENQDLLSHITDEELAGTLSKSELLLLRDKVVSLEKYEWAGRLTGIMDLKYGDDE